MPADDHTHTDDMDTHADTHTHEKKKSYEAKIYKKNSFAIIVAINIPITQLLKKKKPTKHKHYKFWQIITKQKSEAFY